MKIDTKEINKISSAIEEIEGWEVEDFKVWQTQSGKDMATIRLSRAEKKDDKVPGLDKPYNNSPGGGTSISMNIGSNND